MRQYLYALSVVLLAGPVVAAEDSCGVRQSTAAALAAVNGGEHADAGHPICRAPTVRQSSMSMARAMQVETALIAQSYMAALDC